MLLKLERNIAKPLFDNYPDLRCWESQLNLSSRVEIPFAEFNADQLQTLIELYRVISPGKSAMLQALREGNKNSKHNCTVLEFLLPELIRYLLDRSQRGWLFRLDGGGSLLPYAITRIDFSAAGQEEQARILIELKANSRGKLSTTQIIITERDLSSGGLPALLAAKSYLKETPELLAGFDRSNDKFLLWREQSGEQFSGVGTGLYCEDPGASHRNTDWSRKTRVVLSTSGSASRLVNDESILDNRELTLSHAGQLLKPLLKKIDRNSPFEYSTEQALNQLVEDLPEGNFREIPVHGYILMFHLELHHHLWVHIDNLTPYQYNPELKDKLVLPKEHVELIDILTADIEVFMEDIVEGKSGGTTVLCSGPPGVGKTLTAEVYAEIIGCPLYRVHSGQLGLNVAEMEKNLKEVLIRAQRWGAVMLIDEADVYIKRRDDNLTMNAVVGVFLRVLEYFNGLLFMTTNRIEDIDEAIISRCIAMIKYHSPTQQERYQIWSVMAEQFGLVLEEAMLQKLAGRFASASGRDIKGLAKLVSRFAQHRAVTPNMEVFEHCASFRGLE
ncbi:MAG: ATP-binding protein [Neptuniibacter sp.]